MATGNRTIDFRLEGTRFVNYNPTIDTGVALTGATQTAFVATTPSFIITNNDVGGVIALGAETGMKQVYLDQLWLRIVGAGTGLTGLEMAIVMDNAARYSSGGTNISANSVQTDMRDAKGVSTGSISLVYAGALTASAAVSARVVGRAILDNAAPVVGEQYVIDFSRGSLSIAARGSSYPVPLSTIGPGQSYLVYLWGAGMTAAPTFEYGLVWIED